MIIDIDHWPLITPLLVISWWIRSYTWGLPTSAGKHQYGWYLIDQYCDQHWFLISGWSRSGIGKVGNGEGWQTISTKRCLTIDHRRWSIYNQTMVASLIEPCRSPRLDVTKAEANLTKLQVDRKKEKTNWSDICGRYLWSSIFFKAFPWFGPEQVLNEIIIDSSCKEVCIDP